MIDSPLLFVYGCLLGCGLAVTAVTYLDAQESPPAVRRRRVAFAFGCAILGLFPVPLVALAR